MQKEEEEDVQHTSPADWKAVKLCGVQENS